MAVFELFILRFFNLFPFQEVLTLDHYEGDVLVNKIKDYNRDDYTTRGGFGMVIANEYFQNGRRDASQVKAVLTVLLKNNKPIIGCVQGILYICVEN